METNPRKKLKLGFGDANPAEGTEENEDEGCVERYKNGKNTTKNSKFCLDISLEEDEKLLDDSGIDLQFCKETGDEKTFKIRRISPGVGASERVVAPSRYEEADLKMETAAAAQKHPFRSRGETPETEETPDGRLQGGADASAGGGVKKTPDKSLFRKVQEKLMYECSLTPKKVKKKCLELKMDL